MRKTYAQLCEDLKKGGGVSWKPGMELLQNANGAVDSNNLGYQYAIQTTSLIRAQVVEQVFYEVRPSDFMPVVVGEGAYMENMKTNVVYQSSGDFESGIQGTGAQTRISNSDVGLAPITTKIGSWTGGYTYSNFEVKKALASNNWDVIRAKVASVVKRWQLGIQKLAFLGSYLDYTSFPGLLSNPGVTVEDAVITENISSMDAADFATFVATLLASYFSNSNSTVLPTKFVIPMSDYLGLATPVSSAYPNVSKLTYLLQAFKEITQNPSFEIKGLAYSDAAQNAGVWSEGGTYRYVLYRENPETLNLEIPLDLNMLAPMSDNGFNWNGVGEGQFTGVTIFRVPEVMYFDHT